MCKRWLSFIAPLLIIACASEPAYDPLEEYKELDASTILDAPSVPPGRVAPENQEAVE